MAEELLTETQTENFLDGISEEHRSAVSGFTNKNELAKGYGELFQKMGTAVQIPNEKSSTEEIAAFYGKLGRPDNKDGYEIDRPEKMPEGMPYDQEFEMTMRGIAHEAGITQSQMKTLVKAYNEYQIATYGKVRDETNRLVEEGDRALKEKWGVDYKPNFELVERACTELIPDEKLREEFAQLVDSKSLRNNPVFGEVFLGLAKSMLDDTLVKGGGPVEDKQFVPTNLKSPEMYATGEDDYSRKARDYFRRTQNYDYGRND